MGSPQHLPMTYLPVDSVSIVSRQSDLDNTHAFPRHFARLAAMVTLLLTLACGNVCGASPLTVETPDARYYTQDGVTVFGENTTGKMKNSSSQKCYNTNNASVIVFSELTNITGISFDMCLAGDGSGEGNAISLYTSTGGVFAIPSSGFTATKGGSALGSLSNIQAIKANQSSLTSISVTFDSPVKGIELKKVASTNIRNIVVTYNNTTLPSVYFKATTTSTADVANVETTPSGGSMTVDTKTTKKTINGIDYYQAESGSQTINLGTGNTFQAGDQIVLEFCGSGNNKTVGPIIQKTTNCTISVTVNDKVPAKVAYIVSAGDGIQGQTSATIIRTSSDLYIRSFSVLRAAAGCPNYSFHTGGNDVQTNNTQSCFVQVGSSNEWQLTNYTIPADTKFFVGERGWWYNNNLGSNNSRSSAQTWAAEMYLAMSFDAGDASGSPKLGQATGAVGTVRIYDNSNWNNLNAAFIPDGYVLKFGSTEKVFELVSGNEYRSADMMEYNSSSADDVVSVGVKNSSDGYVETAHTQEMRHVFLDVSTLWYADNAKFVLYDVTHSAFTCAMVAVSGVSNLYEGWVPSSCAKVIFVRRADNTLSFDSKWNQTGDLDLASDKNLFTISDWGTGSWSTYEKSGKFRMDDNSKSKNWYVRFCPYHVLTYDANGGSGAPAAQSVAADASPCQLTVSSTEPTRTDYIFEGWSTSSSAVSPDGAWDPGETHAMTGDVTLYAVWTACSGPTINSFVPTGKTDGTYEVGTTLGSITVTATAGNGGALSYLWYQYDGGNIGAAVAAAGTNNAATYNIPNNAACVERHYYCVVSEAGCSTTRTSDASGALTLTEPVDPCSEPAEVTNEIARFFVPCGTDAAYNVTNQTSSTGDNTYTTTGFNGDRVTNATTGFIYGKLAESDNYIQLKLNTGNFRAGDVVNAYFSNNNANNNLKLKSSSGNELGAASASGYDSEYVRTYTLKAADIESYGSIKFFRKGSDIRVNRIIVTREPACFEATITKSSESYTLSTGNGETKDITSDATITSGGSIVIVNNYNGSKTYGFNANGVSISTTSGYIEFTLPSSSILTTGSVIIVTGTSDDASHGLAIIDDAGATVASQKNNGAINLSYTVTAESAINGLNHIRVNRATNNTVQVKSVMVMGCGTEETYIVTYKANGATGSDVVDDAATTISDVPGTFTAPGEMVFMNWNTIAGGGGDTYEPGDAVTSDLTLYAQWGWQLTYDANAGGDAVSNMPDAELHKPGTYTLSTKVPTRAGYTFDCWNRNAAGTGECFSAGASFTTGALNETLYAKWAASTYTLTASATVINPMSEDSKTGAITGSFTNNPVSSIPYGSSTSTSSNTFTVNGTTVTAAATINGTAAQCDECTYRFDSWENIPATVTADVGNIHAKYNTTYTISYTMDGGSWAGGYSAPAYYVYETGATLPTSSNITRDGYTFDGWTNDYDDSAITSIDNETGGNVSVTAHWTAAGYSVTYNGNGNTSGSVPTDATEYDAGDVVTVKGNTGSLTKTGYVFRGWNTASDNTGTFYPADYQFEMPASNVTLYAVWGTGQVCYTLTDFQTSSNDKSDNKPDSEGKYFYGYMGTKDAEHALTITATNGDCIGQNSGANLKVYGGKYVNIYADNTTTGGTPATFSNVTSVSIKAKVTNASYIATFDIMVGSTTIADDVSLSAATSSFQTYTYDNLSNLNGKIKIINNNGGSSSYSFLVDDIEICTGSGSSGYTVTFDNNGEGSYSRTISNVPDGSKIGEPIPAPTADGNTFGGWYKEAGCTNAWNFATETVTADKTLYAKWTNCRPVISTQPVGNTYTQGTVAAALTVVPSGDVTGYQWYSNDENNATTGTPIDGQTTGGYTPETAVIGTTYYYCVVSNACGSVASNVVAIVVNDGKETPCAAWTVAEPTHGGKGFTFSVVAKKHDCSTLWDGALTAAMLTADENVVLSDVTVDNTTKTISGTYGVKGTAESPVTFYLTLPATGTQSAATLSYDRSFTACVGGDGDPVNIPVLSASTSSGTPTYRWETASAGWIAWDWGASTLSSESASFGGFSYRTKSGKSQVLIYSEVASVKKLRLYVYTGGNTSLSSISTAASYSSDATKYSTLVENTDYTKSYSTDLSSSKTNGYIEIIFNEPLAANTFIRIVLNRNTYYYGAILYPASDSGTQTTTLAWSNSQADGATVEKNEDAADFTITATRSNANALASLGAISYSSSNTAVATVNAATGQVTIADGIDFGGADYKETTITAILAASGCYKKATITYVLHVNKFVCTEAAGTVSIKTDNGCSGQVLTVTGFEEGTTDFQWYKNGDPIIGATNQDYTANTSGEYTVVTNKTCAVTSSNSITVTIESATATKLVDEWYVKKDRRTPDIALVQTTKATDFTVSPTDIGGCIFYLGDDGIIYLKGEKDNGDEPAHEDGSWTAGDVIVTITATACANSDPVNITIHKQAVTAKPQIAFVVDGGEGKSVDNVTVAKTSSRAIWTYLSTDFALTGCNVYWTTDEKALRQYYSQYDAILITDDPNTQKTPGGDYKKYGYVNAMGSLIDIRPLLTMEAYVSALENWDCVKGTPVSPSPREYVLKLQCKEHAIYASLVEDGSLVRQETVDGVDYWYVTIVDATNSTYSKSSDIDDAAGTPALQGFDGKVNNGMLGIGTIADETLQGGIERQKEPAARMMVLGINNKAMAALTTPGMQVINNALHYLLETDMESLEDCSNYFHGGTSGHETDWQTASNWTSGKVPDQTVRARILAPCEINGIAHAASIDIAVGGRTSRYHSGGKDCEGSIIVNANGALIVGGQIHRIESAPNFSVDNQKPTKIEDITILADESHNGALVFDNHDGMTKATVHFYSKAYTNVVDGKKKKHWQYFGIPIHEAPIPQFFYGAYTYLWEESSSEWVRKRDGSTLYEWDPLAISYGATMDEQPTYILYGELTSTENYTANLTYDGIDEDKGYNLIGNSWTAPLQIANFEEDDFGDNVEKTVYIHNTGRKEEAVGGYTPVSEDSSTPGQWISIAINAPAVPEYDGITVIPAMQAFEVHATAASTLTLNYDRLVRGVAASDINTPMRAPKRYARTGGIDAEEVKLLKVQVADQKTHTSLYILHHEGFSEMYDNGWDARYSEGSGESATLYAITPDGNMAMAAVPEIDGTVLGFAPGQETEYTFSFKFTGDEQLYLNDMQLQQSTLIANENTYMFTCSENDMKGRFVISAKSFDAVITGNEKISNEVKPIKFIKEDKLFIWVNGVLYDATGKVVK